MPKKVLSINANKSMSFLLQTYLSSKYGIISTADVSSAIRELKKRKVIELLIIDIDYNTEENIDFVSHIQSSWLYGCPIVVLTSNNLLAEQFVNNEQSSLLMKPFNPEKLLKLIDKLVSPLPVLA